MKRGEDLVNWKESEQGQDITPGQAPDHQAEEVGEMATSQSKRSFAAFQFYPRDFLANSKVARMSMTERGIYITLLSYAWIDDGIPSEPEQIARLVRIPATKFGRIWAGVLSECFVPHRGKLVNPRQERQRKDLQDYVASCSKGGEQSARKRKELYGTSQPVRSEHRSGHRSDIEVPPNTASSSSTASASSFSRERHAPIVARRRLDAAWEGPKGLYVPQRKHSDFVALRNHPEAEAELFAWYDAVAETWEGSPGAEMFKFWTARYDEKWPAPISTKVEDRRPMWART